MTIPGRASDAGPECRPTVTCLCGATYVDRSHDHHACESHPILICDRCNKAQCCKECKKQCPGCGERLCQDCQVEVDSDAYCPECAGDLIGGRR